MHEQAQIAKKKVAHTSQSNASLATASGSYLPDNRRNELPFSELNAPLQAQFYLQGQNGATTWMNHAPDPAKYENTNRTKWMFGNYPIYKHKLLDSRARADIDSDATVDQARQTGVVPNHLNEEVHTVSAIIEALTVNQRKQFNKAYNALAGYCENAAKRKVIEGALTNVGRGPLFTPTVQDGKDARAKEVFVKRFQLMVNYIKSVGNRKIGKGPQKVKSKFWIESTGSDPHAGGKHALFLVNKKTKHKQVYKPHSLKFEDAFIGKNGIISDLNKSAKAENHLPTMHIDPKARTEEFVNRVGDKEDTTYTKEKHAAHSEKLGRLETVSHVFGVADLHAQNVLFGANGPVPIDAEVGGSYPDQTGIDANSGPGRADVDMYNTPSALFVNKAQEKINGPKFNQGKSAMGNLIKTRKKSTLKKWRKHLRGVDSFRVLPIDTGTLATCLHEALDNTQKGSVEKMYTAKLKAFIDKNELAKHLKLKIVGSGEQRFWNILRNGTLPAFEFQMKTGNLLMDGGTVATPGVKVVTAETNVLKLSELAKARIEALP